jgi:hypothetical protein
LVAAVIALASAGAPALGVTQPAAAAAAGADLAGCPHARLCVVDAGRIVYRAYGNAADWPPEADDRADRIVNNGSAYDVVVYEVASAGQPPREGWALCVPRGGVVTMAELRPGVVDQASGHRWVVDGTCGGRVAWVRAPGAAAAAADHNARSVEIARAEIGVREVPHNRGARVTEYQRSVRDDRTALAQPWCASFLTWVAVRAGDPTPFRSAIVRDWVRAASAGRAGLSFVAATEVRAGDLVVLRKDGEWQHMGIVSSASGGIRVISGNTGAPDKRADGVFEKPLTNWTAIGYRASFLRNAR